MFLVCNRPYTTSFASECSVAIIDVGQGLSQIVTLGGRGIVFDMGPFSGKEAWFSAYHAMGSPTISSVVISHRDSDHSFGLRFLDSTISWSGHIVASCWEDTAYLRSLCTSWHEPVTITTIAQDDTIAFSDEILIRCFWPPQADQDQTPVEDGETNHYSLVCGVYHGNSSVMLTGDIDSSAGIQIARTFREQLHAAIEILPHHGSAASVCPLLSAYIAPSIAVISYGAENEYGHPSTAALLSIAQMGVAYHATAREGTLVWVSNGFYWAQRL